MNDADIQRRIAFTSLHWPGWTFEAAIQHPTRSRIIDLIAMNQPKKMETHVPIERIEREAQAAAQEHQDINAACPYPFNSDAGRLFKQFFNLAHESLKQA